MSIFIIFHFIYSLYVYRPLPLVLSISAFLTSSLFPFDFIFKLWMSNISVIHQQELSKYWIYTHIACQRRPTSTFINVVVCQNNCFMNQTNLMLANECTERRMHWHSVSWVLTQSFANLCWRVIRVNCLFSFFDFTIIIIRIIAYPNVGNCVERLQFYI